MHPTVTATVPSPSTGAQHITACLEQLQDGSAAGLEAAYQDLFVSHEHGLTAPLLGRTRKQWLDAVFAVAQVGTYAARHPALFADLVIACTDLVRDPDTRDVAVDGDWPAAHLAALGPVPNVAAILLELCWMEPERLGDRTLGWMLDSLGSPAGLPILNDLDNGLAAIACNLLWVEVEDVTLLCKLVAAGVDTMVAKDVGLTESLKRPREGVYSGFVQPLEHVLGRYVGPLGDPALHATLTAEERARLPRAERVLQALAARGPGKVGALTSYQAVRASELVDAFAHRPGSIWGFEHIRLPYVQAAHATTVGKQPIRMLELWLAVEQALTADAFQQLLADPTAKIKEIVDTATATMRKAIDINAAWVAGYGGDEFLKAFEVQCTEYLRFLATTDPTAKFLTAEKRGHTMGKYTGAFACKAGLWWAAQRQQQPIYYCLDGIRRRDVVNYKTFKTKAINTWLKVGGRPYNEAITLAEVREILTNWSTLGQRVVFVRRGVILRDAELHKVLQWIPAMREADARVKGKRDAPPQSKFAAEADRLDPDLRGNYDNTQIMQIVARAELVVMAAGAQTELLNACLYDPGSSILFKAGLMPWGLRGDYRSMLAMRDAAMRRAAAEKIERVYGDGRVSPYLWAAVLPAVKRFAAG
jgi:hypothetical protein